MDLRKGMKLVRMIKGRGSWVFERIDSENKLFYNFEVSSLKFGVDVISFHCALII